MSLIRLVELDLSGIQFDWNPTNGSSPRNGLTILATSDSLENLKKLSIDKQTGRLPNNTSLNMEKVIETLTSIGKLKTLERLIVNNSSSQEAKDWLRSSEKNKARV